MFGAKMDNSFRPDVVLEKRFAFFVYFGRLGSDQKPNVNYHFFGLNFKRLDAAWFYLFLIKQCISSFTFGFGQQATDDEIRRN